jgi:Arc/MetJ-type ribon-helix-helix transcriptional regulator
MMRLITVYVPEAILETLDQLVRLRIYPNRSEAIRYGIKNLIDSEGGVQFLLNEACIAEVKQ